MTLTNNSHSRASGLLICYFLILSFWACGALVLSLLSRNVAGQTKKSIVVTVNFLGWCTGNAIGKNEIQNKRLKCTISNIWCLGPQVFLTWDGPHYVIAFATHLGCYALLLLTLFSLRVYYIRQNKAKAQRLAEGVVVRDVALVHSFEDLTDMENDNFTYIY